MLIDAWPAKLKLLIQRGPKNGYPVLFLW